MPPKDTQQPQPQAPALAEASDGHDAPSTSGRPPADEAPTLEAVLGTVLHVGGRHFSPGGRRHLRQASRECRQRVDSTTTTLCVEILADLRPHPHSQPYNPPPLRSLLPRFTALRKLECKSTTPGSRWLHEELGALLELLLTSAPQVAPGIQSLSVQCSPRQLYDPHYEPGYGTGPPLAPGEVERLPSVAVTPQAISAIAAALPNLKVRGWVGG